MPQSLIHQIQHENDRWRTLIYYVMNENVLLKTRLAQVLLKQDDKKFLEKAEKFLTRFLDLDHEISHLRAHLAELTCLVTESNQNADDILNIKHTLIYFRRNILLTERHLSKLRLEFYEFLYSFFEKEKSELIGFSMPDSSQDVPMETIFLLTEEQLYKKF
ncbi:MAG: hypothetical protein ABJC12_06690 [Saprospiraceae bacterium]